MITRFFSAFLILITLLSLPVTAQEQTGEATVEAEVTEPTANVAVEPVARDDEIAQRILKIMRATGWFSAPQVNVQDGIVFLDGRTDDETHKAWARNLAANTQDVVAVVNRIEVTQTVNWSFAPALQEIKSVTLRLATSLPLIVLAVVILPVAWWLSTSVARAMRRWLLGGLDSPFLKDIVSRILALPIFLVGLYIVLQVAGLTQVAFSIIGGAGVLGIVIGFAFRDIAENFLASLLLSIRRPFRGGDYIEVAGEQGSVQAMNTRSTILLSPEGNHIQIPNSVIFKSTIVNYSASPSRRVTIDVGVGYDVSVARAQEIITGVLARHEAVVEEPHPMVLVDGLGSSTVNIRAYFWVDAINYSVLKVKSAILRLVKKELTEQGISMPDDAREVIFPQGVPIVQLEGKTEERAQELAKRDIVETAETAQHVAEPEATTAEAGDALANEQSEIDKLAAKTGLPENDTDLLSEKG